MGVLAAVTRGAEGSDIVTPSGIVHVDAVPVAELVDTTGAGDLYAAGFLFGLTHGYDPESSGRLGSLCAAEAVSHYGARPATDLSELAEQAGFAPGGADRTVRLWHG
jgi:sugar/nucleoside kinase (ribokinase family)